MSNSVWLECRSNWRKRRKCTELVGRRQIKKDLESHSKEFRVYFIGDLEPLKMFKQEDSRAIFAYFAGTNILVVMWKVG